MQLVEIAKQQYGVVQKQNTENNFVVSSFGIEGSQINKFGVGYKTKYKQINKNSL